MMVTADIISKETHVLSVEFSSLIQAAIAEGEAGR